jgi:hypothetical protein
LLNLFIGQNSKFRAITKIAMLKKTQTNAFLKNSEGELRKRERTKLYSQLTKIIIIIDSFSYSIIG